MNTAAIESLLRREIGLDIDSIGVICCETAVRARLAALGVADADRYPEILAASREELDRFIDEITVPETWFLRNVEQFNHLTSYAIGEFLPAGLNRPLRLLSVPCSTGEEPYSIAIALMDAGLNASSFHVDAVDINQRSLRKAREAVYGGGSFRERAPLFRERFFMGLPNGRFRLRPEFAAPVRFLHGNLIAPDFLRGEPPYDVAFCRNLLIYLERPAQEAALAALRRVVCKHGLIFVGHAETTALVEKNFEAVRTPHAFAYRNAPPVRPTPLAERRAASKVSVRAGPLAGGQPTATSASPPPPHAPAATPELPRAAVRTDEREALLALAESLADQGRLAEAENLCGKLAQEDPMEPHALFLLGIIARAKGDLPAAEACLRKVLYLDAAHPDALLHLAFLLERQGQFDAAERLRDRGRRARHDGKATP